MWCRPAAALVALAGAAALAATSGRADPVPAASPPPPLVGPAFGTTYRVQCARVPAGRTPGELHRAIEEVLAEIDRWASTWRADADASRVGDAAAGAWVPVAGDLVALVETARAIHDASAGSFDVTIGPLVAAWGGGPPRLRVGAVADAPPTAAAIATALARVGMGQLELRPADHPAGPALRAHVPGMILDLSGIVPGHAVDLIGTRLAALGSTDHLVELGGEVRAWGHGPDGTPWRVALRTAADAAPPRVVPLAAGEALAVSTARAGRSPLDPRTGRPPQHAVRQVIVRARSCAVADAWAVACLVRGSGPPDTRATAAELLPLAVEFVPAIGGAIGAAR